jgi:hypothetical protein
VRNRQLEGNRRRNLNPKEPGIPIPTKRTKGKERERWVPLSLSPGSNKTLKDEKMKTGHQDSEDYVEESTSRQGSRTNNATQSKIKEVTPAHVDSDDSDECESMYADEEYDDELKNKSASTKQNSKTTPMSAQHSTSFSNGAKESTSRQGSRTNSAAQPKTKKRTSTVHRDEERDTEIPMVDPKKKKKKTPKPKAESTPVYPQYSTNISNGSGNMYNHEVGNFKFSTIQDAFNDNSVNTIYGERRNEPRYASGPPHH